MEPVLLEVSGYILKMETLTTIKFNILPGTLVLENSRPFPGYFGPNLPDMDKPRSIFLILCDPGNMETVGRLVNAVKKSEQHTWRGHYAEIHLKGEVYPCIRVQGLDCFSKVAQIQTALQHEGVHFRKAAEIGEEGLIKVFKTFLLRELGESIYQDATDPNKMYFTLPQYVAWTDFERITRQVKNNLVRSNFDAATGVLFRYAGLEDIVRIYGANGMEHIREIRRTCLDILKKYYAS